MIQGELICSITGPVVRYSDGMYLLIYNMKYLQLIADLHTPEVFVKRSEINFLDKKELFKSEGISNRETLIKYLIKDCCGDEYEVNERFVKSLSLILFDSTVRTENTLEGPIMYFNKYKLQLNAKGQAELLDTSTGDILATSIPNIYKAISVSSSPEESCNNFLRTLFLNTKKSAVIDYLCRTDAVFEFARYIKQITIDAGDNAIYTNTFNESIMAGRTVDDTIIKVEGSSIRINNNGKIVIVDGDALGFEIDNGVIKVSSKGLKKDIEKSRSLDEAVGKVTSRLVEVLRPCGEQARSVYEKKIKPQTKEFAKTVIADLKNEEKEARESKEANTGKSFNKRVEPKMTSKNNPTPDDSTKNLIIAACMFGVIVFLLIIGGIL